MKTTPITFLISIFWASIVAAQTQPDPRVLLDNVGATSGQVLLSDGVRWSPGSLKVDYVADSAGMRAYNGGAEVLIMGSLRGGKFKKNPTATADQYMVFTDALGNKWERFDYGAFIFPEWFGINVAGNNATGAWKRTLRYAQVTGEKVQMRYTYRITDSILLTQKVHIEGGNILNETSVKSYIDFDIPGNTPAIIFTPRTFYSQGPILKNLAVRDISASGNRHFMEFFGEISDQKSVGYFTIENMRVSDFNRYAFYFNDCYATTLTMNNLDIQSCGGVVGVDMSGSKLITQSQGDTWTISNVNMGGNLPDVLVASDTAFVDVRDVGNVVLNNITLQGNVGSGLAKQLIWADYGQVFINHVYVEFGGAGTLSNMGKFGATDNPNCDVQIRGLYFALGSPYASKTFNVYGPTSIKVEGIEFAVGSPASLFTVRGSANRNIDIINQVVADRPPRVDFNNYAFPVSLQGDQSDLLLEYPYTDVIWKLGRDSLFGQTGYGVMALGGGALTQDIDATKGKCYKLTTTGSRAYFTLDLALPPSLRGKPIAVSMTYKFITSDSVGGPNRWAISDALGGQYISLGTLQLNRWLVGTDVFIYPETTTTSQIVFGDAGGAYDNDNCQLWVKDITISYGRRLKPEEPASPTTENNLVFRQNISGVNAAGFNNGDLVSTPNGLYQKQSGTFVLLGSSSAPTATNGLKISSGTNVVLGDDAAGTGQPAALLSNRFINQHGFNLSMVGTMGTSRPNLLLKDDGSVLMSATTAGQANHHLYYNPTDAIFYANYQGGSSYTGNNKVAVGGDNSLNGGSYQSVIGTNNTLSTTYSAIAGYNNTVSGTNNTFILGRSNTSTIGRATILGTDNVNNGDANIIAGYDCDVIGDFGNVAMGESANITGNGGNISLGRGNYITGSTGNVQLGHSLYSVANFGSVNAGISNVISGSGQSSIVFGSHNRMSGFRQIQIGYGGIGWNNTNSNSYTGADLLLSVNNGDIDAVSSPTDTSRASVLKSNALTVLYNGSTQINNIAVTTNKTRADVTPQAALEVVSTTQGMLIPRMTGAQITTWIGGFNGTTHATGPGGSGDEKHSRQGEQVYNLDTDQIGTAVWNGSAWSVQYPSAGGESTTIGNFQPTGTLKGLSLSGTDIRLHTATTTTAGAVDTVAQSWKGQKEVQRTSASVQESFRATNTGTGGAAYGFKSNGVTLGHIYADESGSQSKIALSPNDAAEPTDYLVADGDVQKVIVQKGIRVAVRSVAGSTTIAAGDYYVRLSTSTAATYTFTLPAGAIGDQFVLLNDGSAGVILSVVGNGSDTVENTASITIGALGETKTFTKTSSTNWDVK